ncbi:TPA: ABC transporter substrate-binding protein, partial [Vibrio cholerae O1]
MNALLRFTLGLCSMTLLAGCGENIDHSKIRSSGFVYCGESAPTTFNPQLADNDITSDALGPQ